MNVSQLEWFVTLGVTIAVLLFDVVVIARRPHEPTMRECAIALSVYIGLAVLFGAWVWYFHGGQFGLEFFAGWLTEYSLSASEPPYAAGIDVHRKPFVPAFVQTARST